jgi:hypothetical protein
MFNTGTVVGVSANVFGADFPPKFIPSFSWGGNRWLLTFSLEKSFEVAERVMQRSGIKVRAMPTGIFCKQFLNAKRSIEKDKQ